MYSSKYAGMVAPYACHQPFALVSRASAASASVVGPSAPYSSHMARTSTARTAVRPLSIRHSLGPDHSSAAAAAATVTAASSRSLRHSRPNCRRGTVDPVSIVGIRSPHVAVKMTPGVSLQHSLFHKRVSSIAHCPLCVSSRTATINTRDAASRPRAGRHTGHRTPRLWRESGRRPAGKPGKVRRCRVPPRSRRYARDLARDAEGRWMNEELGPALRRLRIGKGYTQRSVADKLCEQAGLATVTRHEVSRWERQLRLPGDEWLRHLAAVLDTPLAHLTAARTTAAARQRRRARRGQPAGPRVGTPRGHARTAAPARLSLRYAHRTASVRVEATYPDPARAEGPLTAFRTMIAGLLAVRSRMDGASRTGTAAGAGSGAGTGAGTGAGLGAGGAAAGAARPGGTVPGGARPGGAASRGA